MELVLASTSPYRRALLERLGIPFRCVAPGVDEDVVLDQGLAPRALAEQLASLKANNLAVAFPNAVIIGGDQLVSFEGRILGKPGSIEAAVEQLRALAGKTHELITAIHVRGRRRSIAHTDVTTLRMRALDIDALRRYVLHDQPIDCAGAYKLERQGIALFESIDSADHSAITGLPLMALTTILRELSFEIP